MESVQLCAKNIHCEKIVICNCFNKRKVYGDVMKIGLQTNTFNKKGYGRWGEDTYKKMKENGFDCSDFDMCDTDTILYTGSREEAETLILREKKLAAEAGIEISQVHGPWRWPARDKTEEDRCERMEKMKESIRLTALLGCKNWVVHPIMPYGVEEIGTEDAQKTWDLNIEFMTELLKTAKEYDVTVCLENMPMLKFSMAKPEDILRFVKTINDEHFKICLDTGHVSVFNELKLGDEVRRLGKEIKVLHVHDNRFSMDLHLLPSFGIIDWEDFAKSLKDIGFDGCFSSEAIPIKEYSDSVYERFSKLEITILKEITANI